MISKANITDVRIPEELRREATAALVSMPEPAFKYGLNIFFPVGSVAAPNDLPDVRDFNAGNPSAADANSASLIRERFMLDDGDRIDAWTVAAARSIRIVRIPERTRFHEPIRIDRLAESGQHADLTLIIAEAGSDAMIVEHLSSKPTDGVPTTIRAARTEIVALPGAKVTHVSIQDFGSDVTSFDRRRARVHKDAQIVWIECAFGGSYTRSRIESVLAEPGADARVMSLCFAAQGERFDLRHDVRHAASHTVSDIRARNALAGTAKTVYRGLVRIEPETRGCNGRQKEDTLLLSPDAEIDAMPDLEIATGDVRAGHSASVGSIDKEKLFYLMSRGLSRADAERTLIEAFFEPVEREMRGSGMEEMVNCLIATRLENLKR